VKEKGNMKEKGDRFGQGSKLDHSRSRHSWAAAIHLHTQQLRPDPKWPRHRSASVWAFHLWLDVSITGLVIYWMLYHVAPTLHKSMP
jgi:hypothetical protein